MTIPTKARGNIGVNFQGAAMLVGWWDGPPVMVLVPSSEPVCIRKGEGPIRVICKVPSGTLRGFPLTEERKRFLLEQGVNPELIDRGQVMDVSDALASQFQKEREAFVSLAEQCGLTTEDLDRIGEAKKKLAAYHPSDYTQRRAKRTLENLLSSKVQTKEVGRPKRISAEERRELRKRADEMKAAGLSRDEIVFQFSEVYELRASYIRRILEDRHDAEETE